LELGGRSIQDFAARIDDDGPLGIQPIEQAANGLADAPPDPIAHHGFPDGPGNREADSRTVRLLFPDAKSREERAGVSGPLVINSSEVFGSQQAYTFRKSRDGTATSRN